MDLNKLDKMLDEALESETAESLNEFIDMTLKSDELPNCLKNELINMENYESKS